MPGVWLYCAGEPVLHVLERDQIPECNSVLDHVAFCGTDLSCLIAKLEARKVEYELGRFPGGGPSAGDGQLFFRDPPTAQE